MDPQFNPVFPPMSDPSQYGGQDPNQMGNNPMAMNPNNYQQGYMGNPG